MILGGAAAARADGESTTSTGSTATPVRRATVSRTSIRSMPLLQRPNRPGHIVGNTLRAFNRRRGGR